MSNMSYDIQKYPWKSCRKVGRCIGSHSSQVGLNREIFVFKPSKAYSQCVCDQRAWVSHNQGEIVTLKRALMIHYVTTLVCELCSIENLYCSHPILHFLRVFNKWSGFYEWIRTNRKTVLKFCLFTRPEVSKEGLTSPEFCTKSAIKGAHSSHFNSV